MRSRGILDEGSSLPPTLKVRPGGPLRRTLAEGRGNLVWVCKLSMP